MDCTCISGQVTERSVLNALGLPGTKRQVGAYINVQGKGKLWVNTIPDFIDEATGMVGEIKDVANLSFDTQIRAQVAYAKKHGLDYALYINKNTVLSKSLQDQVDAGDIIIKYIEDIVGN